MPQTTWHIRIEPVGDRAETTRYKVIVDYGPGTDEQANSFEAELPPSFADLIEASAAAAEAAPGTTTRAWRSPPGTVEPDMLAYNAGDLATLKEIGARLHQSIFCNPAGGNTFADVFKVLYQTSGVRIALDIPHDSKLARIPWEAMLPAGGDRFLATDIRSNIVRLTDAEMVGDPPPPVELPMRMLVAVANPEKDLRTGAEVADIERRVKALAAGGNERIVMRPLWGTTRRSFRQAMREYRPHILHFIGHGAFKGGAGLIYFHDQDDTDRGDPITSADLRSLLENDRPWLVVLNSCLGARASRVDPFGGAAHNLIRINIPFVVAMQYPISDEAAIEFASELYGALSGGHPVPEAVSRARMAIRDSSNDERVKAELITPVLYVSSHSTLDTIALAPPAAVASPPSPPITASPVAEPTVAAPRKGWRNKALALAMLLGGAALALLALLFLSPLADRQPAGSGPSAMESSPSTAALPGGGVPPQASPEIMGSISGIRAPVRAGSAEPQPGGRPIGTAAEGSGIGFGSAGSGATAAPRPRPQAGMRAPGDRSAGDSGQAAGSASGDYVSEASDIAVSGWGGRRPLRIFLGSAASLRDGEVGIAAGATLGARTGAWSHRVQAAADLTLRKGGDRARVVADYTVERPIGDSPFRLTGELAYARNDRTGLRRRFVESVGVRWASGGVALTAAAAVQTRFARGDRSVDARRSAIGGLARIETFTGIGDAVTLDARAQILAADPLSANAGAKVSYRLSGRTALVVSADVDHERNTPTRRRTSVIARAGVAFAF